MSNKGKILVEMYWPYKGGKWIKYFELPKIFKNFWLHKNLLKVVFENDYIVFEHNTQNKAVMPDIRIRANERNLKLTEEIIGETKCKQSI